MNKFCVLSLALLWAATASAAEDFDGSRPMDCKPHQIHDCLPTEKTCMPPKPEAGRTRPCTSTSQGCPSRPHSETIRFPSHRTGSTRSRL